MGGKGIVEKRENHTNVAITEGYKKDQNNNNDTILSGKIRNNSEISYEHMDRVKEVVVFLY